ncbi:uncharacterized protein Smr isoform X2 [Bactrocera oleae]|uniref:uncharacterized protein Smr isoform X2 n=1 Tax=Bactrocera oleae TaxID=104688 RepID=UPI00387EE697
MEAAIRSTVQVGGPPPTSGGQQQQHHHQQQQQQQQRGGNPQQQSHLHDNGPSPQQQQQQQQQQYHQPLGNLPTHLHHHHQPPQAQQSAAQQQQQNNNSGSNSAQQQHQQQQQQANISAYQQRMASGPTQIHRPIDGSQSYTKGGGALGQQSTHSAAAAAAVAAAAQQQLHQQMHQMHQQHQQQHQQQQHQQQQHQQQQQQHQQQQQQQQQAAQQHHQQQAAQQQQQQHHLQHHPQQQQQQTARSAASPLSPPRPGPGSAAAANTYAKFAELNAVREAPHPYIQQTSYGIGPPGAQYRDNPYTRIPQMAPDFQRAAAVAAVGGSAQVPVSVVQVPGGGLQPPPSSVGSGSHLEALHFAHQQPSSGQQGVNAAHVLSSANVGGGNAAAPLNANNAAGNVNLIRQRIILPAHHYPSEYLANANAVAAANVRSQQQHQQLPQAPPDPGGQPYKKMRLTETTANTVSNSNHLPPKVMNAAQPQPRQPSPSAASLAAAQQQHQKIIAGGNFRNNASQILHQSVPHSHLTVVSSSHVINTQPPPSAMQQLKVDTQPAMLTSAGTPPSNRSITGTVMGGSSGIGGVSVGAGVGVLNAPPNESFLIASSGAVAPPVKSSSSSEGYHPQVEAISPTLPNDNVEERGSAVTEELLTQIQKVDADIQSAENTMEMLRKKEKGLNDKVILSKQQREQEILAAENDDAVKMEHTWRLQTLAQKIYEANRKTAAAQHSILNHCGNRITLPLYNQPLDVELLSTLIKRHQTIVRTPLLDHICKLKHERWEHNNGLVETYAQMSSEWQKRVEKSEGSAKRKAREAKNREFFEKVFTELRKQREDKERFNRVGSRIKSEADLEEIMDGLQEQAMEDKKMRSYAVIPPLMFDARQRRCVYHNENGFIEDMVVVHKERQTLNVWTAGEKEIFKEKFLQHPKNFGAIAASLDRKSAQDCVRYYYLSKKTENYKQLLRKSRQRTRSSRNPPKAQQQQTQCIIDSLTTGVTTRLQREQQQKTGGRSAAAERERAERAERAAERAAADAAKAAATAHAKSTNKGDNGNNATAAASESTIAADTTEVAKGKANATSPAAQKSNNTSNNSNSITVASGMAAAPSKAAEVDKASESSSAGQQAITATIDAANSGTAAKAKSDDTNASEANSKSTISTSAPTTTTINTSINVSNVDENSRKSAAAFVAVAANSEMDVDSEKLMDEKSVVVRSIGSDTNVPPTEANTFSVTNVVPGITHHPPGVVPNGIKTIYATTMAQAGAAASANEDVKMIAVADKIGAAATAATEAMDAVLNTLDAVSGIKVGAGNSVATPTTSTTAGNFLGQKLKAAQVEGIGAGNDVNSDVSDPKRKRLDVTTNIDGSPINSSSSSSTTTKNNNNNASSSSMLTSTTTNIHALSGNPANNNNNVVDVLSGAGVVISTPLVDVSLTTTLTTNVAATPASNGSGGTVNATAASITFTTTEGNNAIDGKDKLAICFVCKAEACPRTRPLKKGRGQQYGIPDDTIPVGARVCNSCQCKSVRNRYTNCPIPTCPNPKDRAKRLHNIPARLFELASDIQDPIFQEFQIPPQATRCCSACLMRIRRKLDLDPQINLTDEDRRMDGDESDVSTSSCDEREVGGSDTASVESPESQRHNSMTKDVQKLQTPITASVSTNAADTTTVTMTSAGVKADERLLPPLGQAPKKQKTSEEYDSSATETADEENENSPANRQSPKVILNSSGLGSQGNVGLAPPIANAQQIHAVQLNGPPQPAMGMPPREQTGANVQDVLYSVIELSLKTKGPPPVKMPSQMPNAAPMHSVKPIMEPIRSRGDLSNNNNNNSNNDVTIVGEFRNEGAIVKQQAHGQPIGLNARQSNASVPNTGQGPPSSQGPPGAIVHPENLATISVVNSHLSHQHLPPHGMLHQHEIKATITPVVKSGKTLSSTQQPPDVIRYGMSSVGAQQLRNNEPEPQTLDLSIKKPARDGPSPHSSNSGTSSLSTDNGPRHQPPPGAVKHVGNAASIYRGPDLGPSNPTYLYHPHPATVGKGAHGSVYMPQVPGPIIQGVVSARSQASGGQPPPQQPPLSTHQTHMQLQPGVVSNSSKGGGKIAPKLSPQLIHGPSSHTTSASPSQLQQQQQIMVGPKGSITHGTPVNNAQQIIVHPSPATLSPKFESILRQTPPSGVDANNKIGSITQGTPIHLPSHHMESKRSYEYYKTSQRQSPAQQQQIPVVGHPGVLPPPQQSSPQAPQPQGYGGSSPYARSPYSVDQSSVLSTRQIVLHDYITSQQMQGQQRNVSRGSSNSAGGGGGGSDKESPSPRNSVSGPASALVFYDKDRGRTEYSSRASPAEHVNSTPSPHRTPPPPRQGVIQRHNTGSKPPSPATMPQNRLHVMPHNYPPAGHDAFSSFVDVAVQQPQLPVPSQQKEEKQLRHEAPQPPSHQQHSSPNQPPPTQQEIRYQMMQLNYHQQQRAAAAAVAAQQHHQYRQQQAAASVAANADLQRRMHAIERDRDLQQKRDREREKEREQRERERERDRDRERERERMAECIAANERDAAGRRMTERMSAVAAAQHYMRGGPETGPPRAIPDRERDMTTQDSTLSAQVLIDAIIKQSIIQGSSEPNPANMNRPSYYNSRELPPSVRQHPGAASLAAAENNGKANSPSVINIDLDSDRASSSSNQHESPSSSVVNSRGSSVSHINRGGLQNSGPPGGLSTQQGVSLLPPTSQAQVQAQKQPQILKTNITFGELADSIIANDYCPNPMQLRPHVSYMPYLQEQQPMVMTEHWTKYNRRMQQKDVEAAAVAAVTERNKAAATQNNSSGVTVSTSGASGHQGNSGVSAPGSGRSNTPADERNIIRMQQTVSPRKYDLMMQPPHDQNVAAVAASHYYHPHGPTPPSSVAPSMSMHARSSSAGNGGSSSISSPHDQRMTGGNSGSGSGVGIIPSSGSVTQNHPFDTMKYVKNRIVEVMRTEDEEMQHQHAHNDLRGGKDLHDGTVGNTMRKTPNQYDDGRDNRRVSAVSSSGNSGGSSNNDAHHSIVSSQPPPLGAYQPQPPVTTFATTTYAYPYSALNVPSSVAGLAPSSQMTTSQLSSLGHQAPTSHIGKQPSSHSMSITGSGGVAMTVSGGVSASGGATAVEPKPLLSAQYEALSDED